MKPHVESPDPESPRVGRYAELMRRLTQRKLAKPRYEVQDEIARGGMGKVLRVHDEDLRRHLAMKVILGRKESARGGSSSDRDALQLARFLEEAQITGQLDHPGIVPVHEIGMDNDGDVYFTMKLVEGRDLRKVFELAFEEQEGWNETRALSVVLRACEAVAYAHKKGVIHRDLKPGNIMVGSFGEVYVMDWGLARALGTRDTHDIRIKPEFLASLESVHTQRREARDEEVDSPILTMDGVAMGTPAYMSPEQARGDIDKVVRRSDVYSMGALLYHLIARRVPYSRPGERTTGLTILNRLLAGPPPSLTSLRKDAPPELVAIVEKAMARDASQRYPDTMALADDLRAYLEHRVVGAYEAGAWAEARKWVRRNRALATSIAASVLVAIGGLAWVSIVESSTNRQLQAGQVALLAETQEAQKNAERARFQEQVATKKANDVLSLSAITDLATLQRSAATLWPASASMIDSYQSWLREARDLVEGREADSARGVKGRPSRARYEQMLVDLRQRAKPRSAAQIEADQRASPNYALWTEKRDALESVRRMWADAQQPDTAAAALAPLENEVDALHQSLAEARKYEFDDPDDAWWYGMLSNLVGDLNELTDARHGLASRGISDKFGWGIVKRMEFAQNIGNDTVDGPEPKRLWDAAIARIRANPQYDHLDIHPQSGLLPIGPDPQSHLEEFAHLQTGEPARRGTDGKLVPEDTMGMVFVLIPGGSTRLGAQHQDPHGHDYDPAVGIGEGAVRIVKLQPYFLSKYEMTQGQWERFTGAAPSRIVDKTYSPSFNKEGRSWTPLHPVEQVSWNDCAQVLEQMHLVIPSEEEWEHAARAGTETPWYTGSDPALLTAAANLADTYGKQHGYAAWNDCEPGDDGNTEHAPVGSYAPNRFGLHDVLGNVAEWCRDFFGDAAVDATGHASEDRASRATSPEQHVTRGGSFDQRAANARVTYREGHSAGNRVLSIGIRPARMIDPP